MTPHVIANAEREWLEAETPEFQQVREDWYLLEYDSMFGEQFMPAGNSVAE